MAPAPEPADSSRLRQARHDTVALLVLLAVLVVLFGLTTWVVGRYDALRAARAWNWEKAGAAALRQGHPRQAATDYRNALGYGRENPGSQFGLATALLQSGELKQARHYFLALWAESPQSGPVNLGLARLEAEQGHAATAVRYYHNAIYGIWPSGAAAHRRAARRELIAFLLRHGEMEPADAEILALASALPPSIQAHTSIGRQLLQVGDNHHALAEFRAALQRDPRSFAALVGAGRAAFRLAQYAQARRYLVQALRLQPHDIVAGPLLATTNQVLQLDPFAFGVSRRQREARAREDLRIALARLQRCAPPPAPRPVKGKPTAPTRAAAPGAAPSVAARSQAPARPASAAEPPAGMPELAQLAATGQQWQMQMRRGRLFRRPNAISQVMSFVFAVEQNTAPSCGVPSGSDLALLLIARQHAGAAQ